MPRRGPETLGGHAIIVTDVMSEHRSFKKGGFQDLSGDKWGTLGQRGESTRLAILRKIPVSDHLGHPKRSRQMGVLAFGKMLKIF